MNKIMSTIKGRALQVSKNPRDKRLMENLFKSLKTFKCLKSAEEFTEIFTEITHSNFCGLPMIAQKNICGNFFPRYFEQLRKEMELPFVNDLEYELRWMMHCFALCAGQINFFLKKRKEYDAFVLMDRYEEAKVVLEEVEEKLGISFWLYEGKFFLYSKLGKESMAYLERFPQSCDFPILYFYELKNRPMLTYREYMHIVRNAVNGVLEEAPEVAAYFQYMLMPYNWEMDEEDFKAIMMMAADISLIDRYILFENICSAALSHPSFKESRRIIQKYISCMKGIQDEHFEAVCFCLDTAEHRQSDYTLKSKLMEAKEHLVSGRLSECRFAALRLLRDAPYCVQAVRLVVEMNMKLQETAGEYTETNLGRLMDALLSVYGMGENRKEKHNIVFKLISSCSWSSWALALNASIIESCSLTDSVDYHRYKKKGCLQYLDVETVCECLPEAESLEYLDHAAQQTNYIIFRKTLMRKEYRKAAELVQNKDLQYILEVHNPDNTLDKKKEYLSQIGKKTTFGILASKYYLSGIDLEQDFTEALHYAIDLLVENIDMVLFIPMKEYIGIVEEMDAEIRSDICVPILYYVQYRYFQRDLKEDVTVMCEDFLYYAGIQLPSLMKECSGTYGESRLVFFLKNVCVPDILSTALASRLHSSMELWQERIDICQLLYKIDKRNEKRYEKEIRELTQKKKIYSELKIIDENRIHVNVEEMRQRLMEELSDEFIRYQIYSDSRWLGAIEHSLKNDSDRILWYQHEPERVLQKLILQIRDAFVSGVENGLDLSLSLSIRHGAISDAIRRPLANAGLITVFNSEKQEYEWNYKFPREIKDGERQEIKQAVAALNSRIESVIEDLKTKYIQIRTEKANPEGIFDYCISEYEFSQLYYRASEMADFSEFLDLMFEYLWSKTEVNMRKMKELLKGEILQECTAAFDTLKNDLKNMACGKKISALQNRAGDAYSEMQAAVDKVCVWFQRSTESKNQDFDLDFAFQMGYETICNMHPEIRFVKTELEKFESDGSRIEGKYLKAYSDIFYNLFDNIYKRAKTNRGRKQIEYKLKQKDGKNYIFLQNDYNCTGRLAEEKKKLEDLRTLLSGDGYLTKVKGEGGTGIPKIKKIIVKDLDRKARINFGFQEEENKFFIEIEF